MIREKGGLTRDHLASIIDSSRPTIARWEKGTNPPPSDILEAIAREFSYINRDWLITGEGPMYKVELPARKIRSQPIKQSIDVSLLKNMESFH